MAEGRKRALWLSQSDKLLEDARRDWCAVGGHEHDVIPLGKVRQGADIPHAQGILFATYATLRSPARQGKRSRLDQIVAWLADGDDEDERHAYQGVIVFDEAHAMANAAGSKGSRGEVRPSQQGRAGLRLQNALPDARILYVSATGATTVPGLAYARRLGLWASGETPFETRVGFVAAMEAGGVAAMEVVARDLKALGLYQARALSYDGVEVDILEHQLTPEQRRIYDSYASAFKIIHANIQEALKATGIVDGDSTLNKNAKSAALSAFEGAKQRFFGHLLTSMKCPSLIRAIEADLEAERSAVVQLVSTGEALMERRIAEIPASEWDDLSIDLTPREYVLDFLEHAFPVQLQEPFEDDDGIRNEIPEPGRIALSIPGQHTLQQIGQRLRHLVLSVRQTEIKVAHNHVPSTPRQTCSCFAPMLTATPPIRTQRLSHAADPAFRHESLSARHHRRAAISTIPIGMTETDTGGPRTVAVARSSLSRQARATGAERRPATPADSRPPRSSPPPGARTLPPLSFPPPPRAPARQAPRRPAQHAPAATEAGTPAPAPRRRPPGPRAATTRPHPPSTASRPQSPTPHGTRPAARGGRPTRPRSRVPAYARRAAHAGRRGRAAGSERV